MYELRAIIINARSYVLKIKSPLVPSLNSLYTKNERKSQEAKGETGWNMHFQKSKKALALDVCVCR